jgi:hypothetical protein
MTQMRAADRKYAADLIILRKNLYVVPMRNQGGALILPVSGPYRVLVLPFGGNRTGWPVPARGWADAGEQEEDPPAFSFTPRSDLE